MIEHEGVSGIRAQLPGDEDVTGCSGGAKETKESHFDIAEQEARYQREDA